MMGFAVLTSRHSKPSLPLVLAACIGVTLFRMDIKKATKAYEAWLGGRIPLIDADLRLKHQRMAQSPFPFLRATFYRWVQLWPQICPELVNAPGVLGVGDLHVENFGTWRDGEGRLIWGVNDFDEVASLPYTNDLVRLAVSAKLAISEHHLSCDPTDACDAILAGYREGLGKGGAPFVLAEQHRWLRELAVSDLRDPAAYWQKFNELPTVRAGLPAAVKTVLNQALPEVRPPFRVVHRRAGLGSLGRRRFTALAEWRGGWIAREAKELLVSAWHWEKEGQERTGILYQRAIDQAVRVADPFVGVRGQWLIRRLAPDCSRIELGSLPKTRDELKLLQAMGWETANIHLGTKAALRGVLKDLNQRPGKWLRRAAEAMAKAILEDWQAWAKA
jgi:hypothetical protein